MAKSSMTIKCTSVAAHFDDHASVLEQYRQHYLMRHVHGYPGSHWTPPLGDYSLCIDLVATGLIANKTKMKNIPHLPTVLLAIVMHRYGMIPRASPDRGGPGLWQKPLLPATGGVLRPIVGIGHKNAYFQVFLPQLAKKRLELRARTLITV